MTDYLDQVATVPFRMARPEDLPTTLSGVLAAQVNDRELCARLFTPSARADLPALLAATSEAQATLGPLPSTLVVDDPMESPPNRDNDLAFGIERHRGSSIDLLLSALLAAERGVLELVVRQGSRLEPETWRDLVAGFDVLPAWLGSPKAVPELPMAPIPMQPRERSPLDALRRWVRGHHVFMVFAQGCGISLAVLRDSAEAGDEETAASAATVSTRLMWASRAALRLAGDSSEDEYQAEVRPTLMPPIAPPRMSGLRWRDHEMLVRELAAARPMWSWLADRRPELLEEFHNALDATYDAHKGVCAHFVGAEAPSLLATARSHRPAVRVLDQFHQLRAQSLPVPGRSAEHEEDS
jgi:hypothetical protein